MQPPGTLQLHPSGPSPAPGLQSIAGGFQKLGEKQLFEKFWKGTFKAVATPRPGSVIVASITARRRTAESETTACHPLKTNDGDSANAWAASRDRRGCMKKSRRKHRSHRRTRNRSFDELLSPRKGKKKKRKSVRRRKRSRSPSHSLPPLRKKKKKKKKKSSKKSKGHRCTSKKSKHSSSSLKHKHRSDERKHKKSSRIRRHRRRRDRRLRSDTSCCHSKTEDRYPLHKSVVHQAFRDLAAVEEETRAALSHTDTRPPTKSVCTAAPKYRSVLSASILPSNPGKVLFNGSGAQNLPNRREGPHDYDSGNDTSSPPSSKTGVSQASAAEYARTGRVASAFRDSASDSGNSVTSFASSCKPFGETSLSATLCNQISNREQITLGCHVEVVGSSESTSCESRRRRRGSSRTKGRSSSSRSRSSGSSKYLGRYSRSSSLSSRSSYSRSPSHSDVRRRGSMSSLSSRGSYSRHSDDRLSDRKRRADSRETDAKHGRKVRKRGRRKSYTPMRKRRRDSPSHLEARRITSARKRPIPYFRPSPPSSIRSTSVSSWSSIFTRSRSPIHSISRSRSRSRSHSFSSYRSYSRSSSWNSSCGSRSRSRSRSLLIKRRKTRH
ncbi:serine/arginine repetitive matrix protein 4 isoform X2 [Oryzias latipes]|uniref:serine/arginine repetitive matrix protein 4 isoform X2 n=1 Tax=Oryzias latipes TaxID=8090 RepID=UPI000CE220B7|nr:serine/arginine repetitive matrix protein 4 isoform X2 [Oryzias latipes]